MGSCVPCTYAVRKCVQVCVCVCVSVCACEHEREWRGEERDWVGGVGCRFQIRHPRSEFDVHIKLRSRMATLRPAELVRADREASAKCVAGPRPSSFVHPGVSDTELSREHSPLQERWGNFRATHGGHEEREHFKQTQHRLLQIHDDGRMMMGFADLYRASRIMKPEASTCILPCMLIGIYRAQLALFFFDVTGKFFPVVPILVQELQAWSKLSRRAQDSMRRTRANVDHCPSGV